MFISHAVPPPTPLPLGGKTAVDPEAIAKLGKREHSETADGLNRLAQSQVLSQSQAAVVTPLAVSGRYATGSPPDEQEIEPSDKRFKTIRKSFSPEEEKVGGLLFIVFLLLLHYTFFVFFSTLYFFFQAYSLVFEQCIRNEEKVISLAELSTLLEGKIPQRYSEAEKKQFIKSVCMLFFFSPPHFPFFFPPPLHRPIITSLYNFLVYTSFNFVCSCKIKRLNDGLKSRYLIQMVVKNKKEELLNSLVILLHAR